MLLEQVLGWAHVAINLHWTRCVGSGTNFYSSEWFQDRRLGAAPRSLVEPVIGVDPSWSNLPHES